jgi:hypothetical protein
MACHAQDVYRFHWSIEGKQAFALRFKQLLGIPYDDSAAK